jgi:hypothetical protein
MKLRIGDQEYDYQTARAEIGLLHLAELWEQGQVGQRSISAALAALDEALTRRPGESDEDFADRALKADEDPAVLRGLVGLIFVCKRHAGEKVSYEDAGQFGIRGFQFVPEESDFTRPDPTTESGPNRPDSESGSDLSSKPSSSAPKKSKTSKVTSTNG